MIRAFCITIIFCTLKVFGGSLDGESIHGMFLCQQSCGLENTFCSNNWIEYERNNIPISKSGTFTEDELISRNCKEIKGQEAVRNYQCPKFWNCTIDSIKKCKNDDKAECKNAILKPKNECYRDCDSFYTVICSGDSAHVFKVKENYPLCVYKGCEINNDNFDEFCPRVIKSHGQDYTFCECLQ